MRIGIDVDDVLADFIPEFRKVAREMFGKPAEGVWPTDWAWSGFGLSKDELSAVWKRLAGVDNFHYHLPAKAGTERLADVDRMHDLFFITARFSCAGARVKTQTAAWLERHFGLRYPCVIVASDKVPVIQSLKLDAFIDDRAETIDAIAQAVPTCKPVLLKMAHNAHCTADVLKVSSFNEFADSIS